MPVQLGTAAVSGETAALPEDALTTSALAYERRAQQSAALAGVPPSALAAGPPPRPRRIAPAHKTEVGGVVPRRQAGSSTRDKLLKGLEQSLALTRDALKRYATKQGREEDALKNSFKEAIVAMVEAELKKQGTAVIEKIPYVNVIKVCVDLSLSFADGVGSALTRVNSELDRKYDSYFAQLREEWDEENTILFRKITGYQAEATRQLGPILAEGLGDVAARATEMVLEKLGEIPGKILDDVAGQIAGQLERRFDLLAVFRQAVKEEADKIPAGRRKVEKLAFNFVSGVFLDQMTDKELQEKLKLLMKLGESIPVEAKLLTSLIKLLAENSYATYAKHVDVAYVQSETRQLLVETARNLARSLVGVRLEASQSGDVEVTPDRIGVPPTWLPSLLETDETSSLRRNEYGARQDELIDYVVRMGFWLEGQRARYREQWRPYAGNSDGVKFNSLQDKWRADWSKAFRELHDAVEAIVRDFGEAWDNGTIRIGLDLTIRHNIGFKYGADEAKAPPFAPFT